MPALCQAGAEWLLGFFKPPSDFPTISKNRRKVYDSTDFLRYGLNAPPVDEHLLYQITPTFAVNTGLDYLWYTSTIQMSCYLLLTSAFTSRLPRRIFRNVTPDRFAIRSICTIRLGWKSNADVRMEELAAWTFWLMMGTLLRRKLASTKSARTSESYQSASKCFNNWIVFIINILINICFAFTISLLYSDIESLANFLSTYE